MQKYQHLLPWGIIYVSTQALLISQFDEPWKSFVFPSVNFLALAFVLEVLRPVLGWDVWKLDYVRSYPVVSASMAGLAISSYAVSIAVAFLRLV